jgi:hypothetical protein
VSHFSCYFSFFPYINPCSFFSLATGARRQHRGPRMGGKKSLAKQSYQRREKLFNATVPNDDATSHALPTEASRDHRTDEEIDAVLPWVCWAFNITVVFLTLLSPGCEDCGQISISTS